MIKRRSLKLGLCMAMLCMWTCLPSVFAAPARPGVITVTQRDGTQLQIRIYGDEYYNYTMTTDGYTLVGGADGDYYFAKLNGKGQLVSTGIKAKPLSKLSAAERQAVAASKGVLPVQTQSQKVMAASRNISRAATDKNGAPALMASSRFKAEGEKEFLVLLVQFKDIPFKVENPKEAFDQMLNADNYTANNATGSVRKFYMDNSAGKFKPKFVVKGVYTVGNRSEYATPTESGLDETKVTNMMTEAVNKAKADGVSLTQFAENGTIRDICIIFSGGTRNDGSDANGIWPKHRALGNGINMDGGVLYGFTCVSELRKRDAGISMTGMAPFCHEFGHALGLPDFYDADGDANGVGADNGFFSLMGYGMNLNDGCTPPALGILERWMLGWAKPKELSEAGNYTLNSVVDGEGYQVKTGTEGDYFLLECRGTKKNVWDNPDYLNYYKVTDGTAWGLVAHHIDNTQSAKWTANNVNSVKGSECVWMVYSNSASVNGKAARYVPSHCFFPGSSSVTSLKSNSKTGFISRAGTQTVVELTDITLGNQVVTFVASQHASAISDVTAQAFQRDAVIKWEDDMASKWTVTYKKEGDEEEQSVEVKSPIVHLSDLTPGAKYTVVIIGNGASYELSVSTPALSAALPRIGISAKKCVSTEPVLLLLSDFTDAVEVNWTVDGEKVSDPFLKLKKGLRRVQAEVTRADGTKEYFVKYVTVYM